MLGAAILGSSRGSKAYSKPDMLDDFSTVTLKSKGLDTASGPGRPSTTAAAHDAAVEEVLSDDEFTRQLQAGMAGLLGDIESSVS